MSAPPDELVVLASVDNRRAAERMVASLGHKFRKMARKGGTSALVVSGNPDGSLKLTQSRALTAGDLTAALLGVSAAWTIGLLGIFSTLKGTKKGAHAEHVRQSHVGSDEHAAHAMLTEAGPHSAIVLVRCSDQEMWQKARARADHCAIKSWHGSLTELLASLDPGSQHDWVRAALGKQTS